MIGGFALLLFADRVCFPQSFHINVSHCDVFFFLLCSGGFMFVFVSKLSHQFLLLDMLS